ncbi:MAG: hypothetical protein QUS09_01585 [Methanotrichaceae archaeon]|nr:hypothetical protein [Methanotrichaceae archaeon]
MKLKAILALALLVICLVGQARSQIDPLAPDYLTENQDPRRATSLDRYVIVDPRLDPLSVDPLVRPLDPEHTAEYLQKLKEISALPPEADLAGRWRLELRDILLRTLDLSLNQNGRVVFGRGDMTTSGVVQAASASGLISQDVLYLDIVSLDDQMLYRCVLRPGVDTLTGSYYAFGPQGAVVSGTISGSKYQ